MPRFWHGMLFGAWVRLLVRNRLRIGLTKWGLAITITNATVFNSLLRPLQEFFYRKAIERTQIKDAPIFIIGHWRSGTTLLHELLVLDGRYNLFWAIVLAFLISGVASFYVLDRQREAFARRVEARAAKASEAFEQRKAREDED